MQKRLVLVAALVGGLMSMNVAPANAGAAGVYMVHAGFSTTMTSFRGSGEMLKIIGTQQAKPVAFFFIEFNFHSVAPPCVGPTFGVGRMTLRGGRTGPTNRFDTFTIEAYCAGRVLQVLGANLAPGVAAGFFHLGGSSLNGPLIAARDSHCFVAAAWLAQQAAGPSARPLTRATAGSQVSAPQFC